MKMVFNPEKRKVKSFEELEKDFFNRYVPMKGKLDLK